MEMTRCMLYEKELPKKLWAETASTTVFLLNRLPSRVLNKKTPFEGWFGYRPDLQNLKKICCLYFSFVPQVKKDKLDKKVEPGVFIGYNNTSKAYRIFQPQNGKILVSRDFKFMKEKQWSWEESIKKQPPEIPQFIDDDMKSTTGYCFSFGLGMFSWSSIKQDIVAQSTIEAEYVAATTTVNQVIWLRRILADLHME